MFYITLVVDDWSLLSGIERRPTGVFDHTRDKFFIRTASLAELSVQSGRSGTARHVPPQN